MERVLLIRGKQKMHPTLPSFEESKAFWFSRGWKVASDEQIQMFVKPGKKNGEKSEQEPEPQDKPARKKNKKTDPILLEEQDESDAQ